MRSTSTLLLETNARIAKAAYAAARGTLPLPDASGLCLAAVRIVVEHALFGGRWGEFYRWRTQPVERVQGAPKSAHDPVARDMERSLTRAGMNLQLPTDGRHLIPDKTLVPGDLLFRWDAAAWKWGEVPYYGHVGILLDGGLVLENINPAYRSHSLQRGVTALTPIDRFQFTTAIRFDPVAPPAW